LRPNVHHCTANGGGRIQGQVQILLNRQKKNISEEVLSKV
jgi:hypothetical protein